MNISGVGGQNLTVPTTCPFTLYLILYPSPTKLPQLSMISKNGEDWILSIKYFRCRAYDLILKTIQLRNDVFYSTISLCRSATLVSHHLSCYVSNPSYSLWMVSDIFKFGCCNRSLVYTASCMLFWIDISDVVPGICWICWYLWCCSWNHFFSLGVIVKSFLRHFSKNLVNHSLRHNSKWSLLSLELFWLSFSTSYLSALIFL